jgi:hypothetical protein
VAWFAVDSGIWSHPKFVLLPDSAQALWLRAGSWCVGHLTDGFVPNRVLRTLRARKRTIEHLIEAGLWEEAEDGYQFHDWSKYQRTRAQVEAEREAWADKKRRQRGVSRGDSDSERRDSGAEVAQKWRESGANVAQLSHTNVPQNPENTGIEGERPPGSPPVSSPLLSSPTNDTTDVVSSSRARDANLNAAFDDAWKHWPKKADSGLARAAFVTLAIRHGVDFLHDAVVAHGDAWSEHEETRYCPRLDKWLKDERWSERLPGSRVQRAGPQAARTDHARNMMQWAKEQEQQQNRKELGA